jgi:guanosine-3',5'-bis(diphosphate) 3'-pyrophosphohydrolase
MDITRIREYLDYKTVLDRSPEQLFDAVMKKVTYLSAKQKQQVKQAFYFANIYHQEWIRLSWEKYMIHPIKVMEFLLELSPDVISLQVALLHDVIEDTDATYDDVEKQFWVEVAELCVGLEKVAKVKYRWEERSIETLKKTFMAMGNDLRVIFIKLADRVHNIQTLHYHPAKVKRQRIAEETLKVYVPIAKRLWLYVFQWLLENGAFYQLDPKEYTRIASRIKKNYWNIDKYKDQWIELLRNICNEDGVPPISVLWRLKSPYRIYTKLQKYKTQDISKIMDIVAFRIITHSISDCYSDLGAIHKHFTPIFSKMKDYIALPKPNNYKSLHTTVLGMFSFPVEIQIRTQEMDIVANYWVAAHFAYSESWTSVSVSENQAAWIQKLQQLAEKYQWGDDTDKEDFKNELNIELLEKNIFVYTPKGDILELPSESTVLDFAFRVHSDVWLKFKLALVNSKIVPIDWRVKTGDIVDIQTFKHKYTATKSWLNYLHTPSARTKLTKYLRHLEKEDISQEMTAVINAKLAEFWLPLLWQKDDKVLKQFSVDQWEQQLLKLRDRQISLTKFLRWIYWSERIPEKHVPTAVQQNYTDRAQETVNALTTWKNNYSWQKNQVFVDGDKTFEVLFCPECKPNNTDSIVWRSWKDGIKIHCVSCAWVRLVNPQKLLEAHRFGSPSTNYLIQFDLDLKDSPWVLLELLKMIEQLHINVISLHTAKEAIAWRKEVYVVLEFPNPSKIAFVLKELTVRKDICRTAQFKFV